MLEMKNFRRMNRKTRGFLIHKQAVRVYAFMQVA